MTTRRTTLGAAALLGLALMVPTASADAAGETCEGRPATIVGTPDARLDGTPGDDVILTNGAYVVKAGNGNDVVCVSSAADGWTDTVRVDAGAGDDTVSWWGRRPAASTPRRTSVPVATRSAVAPTRTT